VASYGGVRSGNRGQKWRLQGTEGTPNISELLAFGDVDASLTNMLLTFVALLSSAHRNNLRRTSDREESSIGVSERQKSLFAPRCQTTDSDQNSIVKKRDVYDGLTDENCLPQLCLQRLMTIKETQIPLKENVQ